MDKITARLKLPFQLFRKSPTQRRLLLIYIVIYVPLFLFMFAAIRYADRLLTQQGIRYNHNTVSMHMATVDNDLYHTSNYLYTFLLNEDLYRYISVPEHTLDTQVFIQSYFGSYLNTFNGYCSLFFYFPDQDIFLMRSASYDSFWERREMKEYIRRHCTVKKENSQTPNFTGWTFHTVGNQDYLIETMDYHNVYVGAFGICSYIFEDLRELEKDTGGSFLLSNQADEEASLFSELSQDDRAHLKSRQYVTIPVQSQDNDYRLSLYIPAANILGPFPQLQYLAIGLAILTLLLFAIHLYSIYKRMLAPILSMITAMEAIQEGDFHSRLAVLDTHDEFAKLTETFNYMINRINDLKIQIYEKKLNQAYARLSYLTLQIKPHFFLNCLNLLYSLGLSGRSELVADFSSALMKHFRYLFKSSESMVTLEEELVHIKNFLHIQQIRFQDELATEYLIDEGAGNMRIPVLSLHTFVENIFKHAYNDTQKKRLRITAYPDRQKDCEFLVLYIEDNGKGFSKDILEQFNLPIGPEDAESGANPPADSLNAGRDTHIGISNVRQRLYYLYGSGTWLCCENRREGGARIIMMLPQSDMPHL